MKEYLIVDAHRLWIDRREVKPGDCVTAIQTSTGLKFSVVYCSPANVWIMRQHGIESHEPFRRFKEFTDFFEDPELKGFKFYLLK